MTTLTPDQVVAMPAGDLANLASTTLFELRNRAAELLAAAKRLDEHIDRALELKYGDQAHKLRLAQGKDTGVIHFDDGLVRITADFPSGSNGTRRAWPTSSGASARAARNPGEYVEIELQGLGDQVQCLAGDLEERLRSGPDAQDREARIPPGAGRGRRCLMSSPHHLGRRAARREARRQGRPGGP